VDLISWRRPFQIPKTEGISAAGWDASIGKAITDFQDKCEQEETARKKKEDEDEKELERMKQEHP